VLDALEILDSPIAGLERALDTLGIRCSWLNGAVNEEHPEFRFRETPKIPIGLDLLIGRILDRFAPGPGSGRKNPYSLAPGCTKTGTTNFP
jgi:hypothetical protein